MWDGITEKTSKEKYATGTQEATREGREEFNLGERGREGGRKSCSLRERALRLKIVPGTTNRRGKAARKGQ